MRTDQTSLAERQTTVSEGMQKLRAARPGIRLTAIQRKCIEQFAAELNE